MCIATTGKVWGVALLMQCCMLFAHKTFDLSTVLQSSLTTGDHAGREQVQVYSLFGQLRPGVY